MSDDLIARLRKRGTYAADGFAHMTADGKFSGKPSSFIVDPLCAEAVAALTRQQETIIKLTQENRAGLAASITVAEIAALVPLPQVITVTASCRNLVQWVKELQEEIVNLKIQRDGARVSVISRGQEIEALQTAVAEERDKLQKVVSGIKDWCNASTEGSASKSYTAMARNVELLMGRLLRQQRDLRE